MENLTFLECMQWRDNPTYNPVTNRKISHKGETYYKLIDICAKKILEEEKKGYPSLKQTKEHNKKFIKKMNEAQNTN
jgi:hypothetical protein